MSYFSPMPAVRSGSIPAGYIGQIITGTISGTTLLTANSFANLCNVALTPGIWLINGNVRYQADSGSTRLGVGISTNTNSYDNTLFITGNGFNTFISPANYNLPTRIVNISANTTYYCLANLPASVSNINLIAGTFIQAIRLA